MYNSKTPFDGRCCHEVYEWISTQTLKEDYSGHLQLLVPTAHFTCDLVSDLVICKHRIEEV